MIEPMSRDEFERLHHLFHRGKSREAWQRWQQAWHGNVHAMTIHPSNTTPLPPAADDYMLVARCGALAWRARVAAACFPSLPAEWDNVSTTLQRHGTTLPGGNPRSRARGAVLEFLLDGLVFDAVFGPITAAAIAWLIVDHDVSRLLVGSHRLFGYDISYNPGPRLQSNFRFVSDVSLDNEEESFAAARALPLPPQEPPPH